jgi:hypothetical protein
LLPGLLFDHPPSLPFFSVFFFLSLILSSLFSLPFIFLSFFSFLFFFFGFVSINIVTQIILNYT